MQLKWKTVMTNVHRRKAKQDYCGLKSGTYLPKVCSESMLTTLLSLPDVNVLFIGGH